jgi:hypothetical protein
MSDTQHMQELIDAHQKRLRVLELQAANFGDSYSPAHLIIEIQELQEKIKRLQEQASNMPEGAGSLTKIAKAVQERLSNLAQNRDTFPEVNFHQAIDAVEALSLVNDQTTPIPFRRLVEIIRVAISHGYKLFNKGMQWECAELYLHSAKRFASLLNRHNLRLLHRRELLLGILRNDLVPILRTYTIAPSENSSTIAWDLRRAFDNILDYSTFQESILKLETAFKIIETPGRSVSPGDLNEILQILNMLADELLEHKQYNYCIELYLYAAKRFHAVLFATEKDKHSRIHPVLRENLSEIIAFETVEPNDDLQNTVMQMKNRFGTFRNFVAMASM